MNACYTRGIFQVTMLRKHSLDEAETLYDHLTSGGIVNDGDIFKNATNQQQEHQQCKTRPINNPSNAEPF